VPVGGEAAPGTIAGVPAGVAGVAIGAGVGVATGTGALRRNFPRTPKSPRNGLATNVRRAVSRVRQVAGVVAPARRLLYHSIESGKTTMTKKATSRVIQCLEDMINLLVLVIFPVKELYRTL